MLLANPFFMILLEPVTKITALLLLTAARMKHAYLMAVV
jgi:hypothetical protein